MAGMILEAVCPEHLARLDTRSELLDEAVTLLGEIAGTAAGSPMVRLPHGYRAAIASILNRAEAEAHAGTRIDHGGSAGFGRATGEQRAYA